MSAKLLVEQSRVSAQPVRQVHKLEVEKMRTLPEQFYGYDLYEENIEINNEKVSTLNFKRTNSPYIIIDSLGKEDNTYTGLYMIQMLEKDTIKLGRSNNNDIIIKDISVSRNHALIKLENESKGCI